MEHLTRDVARIFGRQERLGLRELLGGSHTPEADPVQVARISLSQRLQNIDDLAADGVFATRHGLLFIPPA